MSSNYSASIEVAAANLGELPARGCKAVPALNATSSWTQSEQIGQSKELSGLCWESVIQGLIVCSAHLLLPSKLQGEALWLDQISKQAEIKVFPDESLPSTTAAALLSMAFPLWVSNAKEGKSNCEH